MATYKVIQDIEAEDKFLGPLTLKQFIFGAAALFFGYLSVFALTKNVPFLLIIFLPPALLGAFLAIPWSSQQPTEVWVVAKLRFIFKPKARVWDQSGLEELVTITAPKKEEKHLTNGLDQTEVQSRLKALAETIDSRGWAVKNATLSDSFMPINPLNPPSTDRLINIDTLPQSVPEVDLNQYVDVLDQDTTVSESFDKLIKDSTVQHKKESLAKMQRVREGEAIEAIKQPPVNFTPPVDPGAQISSDAPLDEAAISQQLRATSNARSLSNQNLHTIPTTPSATSYTSARPILVDEPVEASATVQKTPVQQPQAEMTKTSDPDILDLAQNNDWNIETIARQAKRKTAEDDEVVVSLR